MNVPGFTAEASLYQTHQAYTLAFSHAGNQGGTVMPSGFTADVFSACAMICAVCVASLTANPLLDPIDIYACGYCMACAGIA